MAAYLEGMKGSGSAIASENQRGTAESCGHLRARGYGQGNTMKHLRVPEEAGMNCLWKLKLNVYRGMGKKEQVEVQGTQMHRKGPKDVQRSCWAH